MSFSAAHLKKSTGAHYTPPFLARFVAEAVAAALPAEAISQTLHVLDPAVGDGELLLALLRALADRRVRAVASAYDTNSEAVAAATKRLQAALPDVGVSVKHRDFLDIGFSPADRPSLFEFSRNGHYDAVIANPPYVRTQVLGAARTRALASKYQLTGRVDLYFAFLSGIADALRPGGLAGVIVSNRFMTTKAGAAVRRSIRERFDVLHVWDLGDTRLFEAAVLPAVLLLKRRDGQEPDSKAYFTSIYRSQSTPDAHCAHPLEAVRQRGVVGCADGQAYIVKHGTLERGSRMDAIWRNATEAGDEWLSGVAERTALHFGDVGKIRVGVKTTADRIFIRSDWEQLPAWEQPELLRDLTTHHIARRYKADRGTRRILYPHEVVQGKRRAIDLAQYPRTLRYLSTYRTVLEGREYLIEAKREWYEIWVPQDPDSWGQPKVVFRDIAERPTFWMDLSGSIVNGDCYFVISPRGTDLLWLLLAVSNSTFIEHYYDHRFNNKLYAGRRRFMTQYVEQFPLPNPDTSHAREIVAKVRKIYDLTPSDEADKLAFELDQMVWGAFGLPIEEVSR